MLRRVASVFSGTGSHKDDLFWEFPAPEPDEDPSARAGSHKDDLFWEFPAPELATAGKHK
jgi:hypothetical protein